MDDWQNFYRRGDSLLGSEKKTDIACDEEWLEEVSEEDTSMTAWIDTSAVDYVDPSFPEAYSLREKFCERSHPAEFSAIKNYWDWMVETTALKNRYHRYCFWLDFNKLMLPLLNDWIYFNNLQSQIRSKIASVIWKPLEYENVQLSYVRIWRITSI